MNRKRVYQPNAEGAIYPHWKFVGALNVIEERRDCVEIAERYCERILSGLSGREVVLREGVPTIDGRTMAMPFPNDNVIDLIRDVEGLVHNCSAVRDLRHNLKNASDANAVTDLKNALFGIDEAIELGVMLERVRIRWEGYEAKVLFKLAREADLRKPGTPVTKKALRLLKNGATQRGLAAACNVSEKIARRWYEEYRGKKT